jgi:hypothetical protein
MRDQSEALSTRAKLRQAAEELVWQAAEELVWQAAEELAW